LSCCASPAAPIAGSTLPPDPPFIPHTDPFGRIWQVRAAKSLHGVIT